MGSIRKLLALAGKIVILTVVLLVVQAIGSRFLPATASAGEADAAAAPQVGPGFLGLFLLVCLLQTAALAYPVLRSRWRGGLLVAAVFVLFFGTVTFQSQVESLVYLGDRMPAGMVSGLFLMGLFTAAVFAPILVLTLAGWRARAPAGGERSPRLRFSWQGWAWRLLVGAAVMLALYYLFGYFVAWKSPAVRDYYGGSDPGSFFAQMAGIVRDTPWMIALQLARSLLWVLLALPVIRMMRGRWWEAGLALSLLFTVPALYLLLPNPLMPDAVRRIHLIETAPYQFLFGWFVAWLFTRRTAPERVGQAGAAARVGS